MLKKHFVWGSPLLSLGLVVIPGAAFGFDWTGFRQSNDIEDRRSYDPTMEPGYVPPPPPDLPNNPRTTDPDNLSNQLGYWDIGSPASMTPPSAPDTTPSTTAPSDPQCSLSTDCRADPSATPQTLMSPTADSAPTSDSAPTTTDSSNTAPDPVTSDPASCSSASCQGSTTTSSCSSYGCGGGCGSCGGCGG
ncbi:MAG TPA: hypothetical protein VFF73_41585 [Planctomycetota bacterium]|nr:hypothetical protein [Planctomycetota bacterium]